MKTLQNIDRRPGVISKGTRNVKGKMYAGEMSGGNVSSYRVKQPVLMLI